MQKINNIALLTVNSVHVSILNTKNYKLIKDIFNDLYLFKNKKVEKNGMAKVYSMEDIDYDDFKKVFNTEEKQEDLRTDAYVEFLSIISDLYMRYHPELLKTASISLLESINEETFQIKSTYYAFSLIKLYQYTQSLLDELSVKRIDPDGQMNIDEVLEDEH